MDPDPTLDKDAGPDIKKKYRKSGDPIPTLINCGTGLYHDRNIEPD